MELIGDTSLKTCDGQALPRIKVRAYVEGDAGEVRALFISVNRALAPKALREAFEGYIARSLDEEIDRIPSYYAERHGGFWVARHDEALVGMFGLERTSPGSMELRRMYVDPKLRRNGIGRQLLSFAEQECRRRGISKLELSTAEIQTAAIALYRRSGYALVGTTIAERASVKTVGHGLRRFSFEKQL